MLNKKKINKKIDSQRTDPIRFNVKRDGERKTVKSLLPLDIIKLDVPSVSWPCTDIKVVSIF